MSASRPGLGDVASGDGRLGWDGCARLDVGLDLGLDGAHERLDLEAVGVLSSSASMLPTRNGSVCTKPCRRMRCWPWTMARTVPSWSWTTWAILASVPTS